MRSQIDELTRSEPMEQRPVRLIRIDEVLKLVPVSTETLYRRIRAGTFPRARDLGGNIVAWLESEVMDWINARNAILPASEKGGKHRKKKAG